MKQDQLLFLDIETATGIGHFYEIKREYAVFHVARQPYLNSVAWAWNDGTIEVKALCDFPNYKKDLNDDYQLAKFISEELLEKADIIIAHNGDRFDVKFINARLMFHRLSPPPPYKTADTLKMHRAIANVPSHRLDYLAQYYGIGKKLAHHGKNMWLEVEQGNMKEWANMKRYNKHDVHLLRELHKIILPWAKTYPNRNLISGTPRACPRCGSTSLQSNGKRFLYTTRHEVQIYRCTACGKRGIKGEKTLLDTRVVMT